MKTRIKDYGWYQGEKRVRREPWAYDVKGGTCKCCMCKGEPKGKKWWFVWRHNNWKDEYLCSPKCVEDYFQYEGWEDDREAELERSVGI